LEGLELPPEDPVPGVLVGFRFFFLGVVDAGACVVVVVLSVVAGTGSS